MRKEVFIEKAITYFREKVLALKGGCRESLRAVFRELGVRIAYNPDTKEGVLTLGPFGQPSAE